MASQSLSRLPAHGFTDTLRSLILQRLATATSTGSLVTRGVDPDAFTFRQPISSTDLGLTENEASTDTETAVKAFFAARAVMEDNNGIRNILLDLRNCEPLHCHFLCDFLRSSNIDRNDPDNVVLEFLNDDDWRHTVFHNVPEKSLERLVSFLIDWQMQCDDEWLIRIPYILAHECERTTDVEKNSLLFSATLMSSLASDVVNPIIRLIVGEKRGQFAEVAELWCHAVRPLSLMCEPWVASRVRGVLGTLESHLN